MLNAFALSTVFCLVLQALAENIAVLLIKAFKVAAIESFADFFHQIVVEIQVVSHCKLRAYHFFCTNEVTDVGAAVITASGALTSLLDGTGVACVFFVGDVHLTLPGKEVTMARVTGGHDAIEEVDAVVNRLKNVTGSTNAHQIARLVGWHIRLDRIDNAVHIRNFLTNRKTANGKAVTLNLANHLHMLNAQILIRASLVDTKEHLVGIPYITTPSKKQSAPLNIAGLKAHLHSAEGLSHCLY